MGVGKVRCEGSYVAVTLAAVIKIEPAIVVAENHGVDWLSTVVKFTDERVAQRVFERARG